MKRQQTKPPGLTLTELLVVVAIVVLVAGAMVPIMQPVIKGQTTREGAKVVRAIFSAAQARAVAKQRPVGVWISRAAHDIVEGQERRIYASYQLSLAEQPPPYSGDIYDARVRLVNLKVANLPPPPYISNPPLYLAMVRYAVAYLPEIVSARTILKPGDEIRFGYRDHWFTLADVPRTHLIPFDCDSADGILDFDRNRDGNVDINWDAVVIITYFDPRGVTDKFMSECPNATDATIPERISKPLAFQVRRQPRKTSAPPVDLPANTAIDLSVSGMEDDLLAKFRYLQPAHRPDELAKWLAQFPNEFGKPEVCPEHDIVIMFGADGGVDRVYYLDSTQGYDPQSGQGFQSAYCQNLRAGSILPRTREVLGPIHLMIGRDDLIGFDANEQPIDFYDGSGDMNPFMGTGNLNEKTNIWLTINRDQITTSPNAGFNSLPDDRTAVTFYEPLRESRQLTKTGLSSGGR